MRNAFITVVDLAVAALICTVIVTTLATVKLLNGRSK